jgi:hypothetical protein
MTTRKRLMGLALIFTTVHSVATDLSSIDDLETAERLVDCMAFSSISYRVQEESLSEEERQVQLDKFKSYMMGASYFVTKHELGKAPTSRAQVPESVGTWAEAEMQDFGKEFLLLREKARDGTDEDKDALRRFLSSLVQDCNSLAPIAAQARRDMEALED